MKTLLLLVLLFGGYAQAKETQTAKPSIEVYRSPTCGCCKKWISIMEKSGFEAKSIEVSDVGKIKNKYKLPSSLSSCHTGIVNGYVIEGHVPPKDVLKLLKDKPKGVIGLAVPAMPVGSPGMEVGDRKDPYDVIAFTKDGTKSIFSTYNKK